jgi:hypothetical protein
MVRQAEIDAGRAPGLPHHGTLLVHLSNQRRSG